MRRSAVDDITLDDLPPWRRYDNPPKPPKPFDWEALKTLGRRLAEATERMNESLCTIEDVFLEKLGQEARGRVELERGETPIWEKKHKGQPQKLIERRPWVEFLVYRRGEFFVESNRSGPRFTTTHLLSTSRETRMKACGKVQALWVACGGILPIPRASGVDT